MYVYIKSEPNLWTVGFYDPLSNFCPESDHDNQHDAAERTAWLNGSHSILPRVLAVQTGNKGNWCKVNQHLFCQENYCPGCEIYQRSLQYDRN